MSPPKTCFVVLPTLTRRHYLSRACRGMRKDLEEKVTGTLARFDEAVKQSSTRRQSDLNEQRQQQQQQLVDDQERELDIDIAERITAETDGEPPPEGDKDKPRCRPWDYEAFIARQRTFAPLTWFSKPASASPPLCARYGWINTGRDTLSCACCKKTLSYSEDKHSGGSGSTGARASGGGAADVEVGGWGADAGRVTAVVQNLAPPAKSFSSCLSSEHHDLCPWNGNACPKEFLQLPPMATEDLLAEFLGRLISLAPVVAAKALPEVSLPASFEEHCPGGLSTLSAKTRAILAQYPSSSALTTESEPAAAKNAAACLANGVNRSAGNKHQRNGGGGGADARGLLAFGDDVVGAAAAIAMFGWGSSAAADATAFLAQGPSNGEIAKGSGGGGGGDDGGASSPTSAPQRLTCALCNRRLVTDNFLSLDAETRPEAGVGMEASPRALGLSVSASAPKGRGGQDGQRGKRRRLSGGGTPLKPLNVASEHRSFCPWPAVHPPIEVEDAIEDAVPGWRQTLDALLSTADSVVDLNEVSSTLKEAEGFGNAASAKAEEALHQVQKVLGVLMRV